MPGEPRAGAPASQALSAEAAAVLEANQRARAELIGAIDALPAERRRERWYGEWSLHEILAHLGAWQDGFAHALERLARGERPEVPGYEPSLPDADDRFNAVAVAKNAQRSWEDLLAQLRAARERHEAAVCALVDTLPPDRFVEGRAARRLASQFNHDREHIPAIIEWRRREKI